MLKDNITMNNFKPHEGSTTFSFFTPIFSELSLVPKALTILNKCLVY